MASPETAHKANDGPTAFKIIDIALEFRSILRVHTRGGPRLPRANGDEAMGNVTVRISNSVPSAVAAAGLQNVRNKED